MTKENTKSEELSFTTKLNGVSFSDYWILKEFSPELKAVFDPGKVRFNFVITIQVNPAKDSLVVEIKTDITESPENKFQLGSIKCTCDFFVSGIKSFEVGKMPPKELLMGLFGVVIATTRGYLISLCQGTILNDVLLPLIDTGMFFQFDARTEIDPPNK